MKILKLKNKLKNERGSITIFVLTSMLFFLVILLSIYMNNVNKNTNINKNVKKIEEQYNVTDDDLEEAYKKALEKDKYPEPLLNSTNVNGNNILKNSDGIYQNFDGTDDQVFPVLSTAPINGGYNSDGSNVLTVSATIKTDFTNLKTTGQYHIVGNCETSGWQLMINNQKRLSFTINYEKGTMNYSSLYSEPLEDNTVYNIVCMFVRGKGYMYLNDNFIIDNQSFENLNESFTLNSDVNVPTLIGGNPKKTGIDSGSGFKGYIYDVKVWDRVLNKEQIKYLINEQNELYKNQ